MKTKRTLFSMVVFLSVFWLSVFFDFGDPSIPAQNDARNIDAPHTFVGSVDNQLFSSSITPYSLDGSETASKDTKIYFNSSKITPADTFSEPTDISDKPMEAVEADSTVIKEEITKKEPPKYSNIGISIANSFVNVRKNANTESNILGKLYRGSAAEIIKNDNDWYYIESGSIKGYVKSEYIETGLSDEELINNYSIKRILVKVDGLNVREDADIESKKLTTIYKNETYPVIDLQDDWIKVDIPDDRVSGYVKGEHVELIVDFNKAVSKEEEAELSRLKEEEQAKKETEVKYRDEVNYSKEELKLLACLVQAEAGNQSYEGKLAVANIVLNRVKSSKYPNSIKAVIYQSGQFSVAKSGSLSKQLSSFDKYSTNSQLLTIKAAKAALGGANNIGSRLYFHSYKAAVRKGYNKKKGSVKLDDHLFW